MILDAVGGNEALALEIVDNYIPVLSRVDKIIGDTACGGACGVNLLYRNGIIVSEADVGLEPSLQKGSRVQSTYSRRSPR